MGGKDVDIEEWLASQDAESVVERLVEAGIPAAVVMSPTLVTENPQLVPPRLLRAPGASANRAGPVSVPAVRRSSTAPSKWLLRTPPTLGQHNAEVLTELCGLTAADLDRLAVDGVIGTRPKGL